MSGYEGGGTDMSGDGPDGPDGNNAGYGYDGSSDNWGGGGDADANIGAPSASTSPNAGMSLAAQYAEYGLGRTAAELANGVGVGASGYSDKAGTQAQQNAFLSGLAPTPAEQIAATQPGIVEVGLKGLLALLGIASATPQGVIGGGLSLNALMSRTSSTGQRSSSFDLGFSDASDSGFSGSSAPDLFGGNGPAESQFNAGAPVIGFGGATVNAPSSGAVSGYGPGLFPGVNGFAPGAFGRGVSPRSPAAFVAGAGGGGGADPLVALLLAGLSIFIMG